MPSSDTIEACDVPVKSSGNIIPPEILLQVFSLLSPRDFDNARHICSQWMRVSLDHRLLETMLKRAGWWDAWQHDCETAQHHPSPTESLVWRMSKRFSTECLLSGRKTNVEKPGFLTTGVVDFSRLALLHPGQSGRDHDDPDISSQFSVSMCGNYVLVTSGYRIHVYRLLPRPLGLSDALYLTDRPRDRDIVLVASIVCPDTVLSATIDASTPRFVVAALLHGRVGMVCDITTHPVSLDDDLRQYHYYHNVCSPEDPPRSIAICPGRRCVAFGAGTGIELRWTDDITHQECRKHFHMTQPSEILHFLPIQPDTTPEELRLVSSLAGPGGTAATQHRHHQRQHQHQHQHQHQRQRPDRDTSTHTSHKQPSVIRATHCHHYRAVPVNDGTHILFIEPQSGFLCIGSDAPIGGPTDLTRALVCAPPFPSPNDETAPAVPSVFAAGADLSWGLRVVAAYHDRLVLYSVPLDVFNVVRKERERQGDDVLAGSDLARDWFLDNAQCQHHRRGHGNDHHGDDGDADGDDDWESLLAVSYRPTAMLWPLKIYGKEIGRVDDVVELALQSSHGGARVWAFRASGETDIIDVDTFTSPARPSTGIPCNSSCVDTDGSVESAKVVVGRCEPRGGGARPPLRRAPTSDFKGQFSTLGCVQQGYEDRRLLASGPASAATATAEALSKQRPAYAACIVGFNIEEVGSA